MKYTHPALNDEMTGEPVYLNVNGHYEVCPVCKGYGTTFRQDLDENNLIDLLEEDGDHGGLDDYYNGAYDQQCTICNGKRVIFSPNLPEWAYRKIVDYNNSIAETGHISRQEQMVGA